MINLLSITHQYQHQSMVSGNVEDDEPESTYHVRRRTGHLISERITDAIMYQFGIKYMQLGV